MTMLLLSIIYFEHYNNKRILRLECKCLFIYCIKKNAKTMEDQCTCGMLVQDPTKGNDVDAIFNQARQLGAVEGPMEIPRASSSSSSFTGTGRLLSGDTVPSAPQQPEAVVHNIVLWRNGFSGNDCPWRSLDDPENVPFLESIRKSECPKELEPVDRRSSVHVNLTRRDENCPEPKERQVAFQGVGRTLGSITPPSGAPEPSDATPLNAAPTPSMGLVADQSLPSTSIKLRFAFGFAKGKMRK